MSMKVVIPLAGFGTRMRPHTYSRPKPLINVAGKTVLDHLLGKLAGLDIEEYIFIVGYLGDQIEQHVEKNYNFKATFVEQPEMLGQAHAIWLAREYLDEKPAFVIFADTLIETDLKGLDEPNSDALIFVKEVEDPRPFGVVTLDEQGYIRRFVEKPQEMDNKLVVVGLYYFREGRALIRSIETLMERKIMTKGEYFLADAMQLMIESGQRFRTRGVSVWLDTGRPDTVLETNRWLLENGHDNSARFGDLTDTVIIPPVHIDPSARLTRSVIGPYVTIGPKCNIEGSVLQNSIIEEGATVKHALLEQSLIGRNARVEERSRSVNVGDMSVTSIL